ncbi:alpha/beta fold hydrolase [Leifsonia sp. fls2-241-R2A-40a]|uniref:alpha/beta hydrolase n=1 Tax=Leifsonia sp. fls2-241-R2A-40a TaxID=3040290 RepID=UPI00254D6121|nr:alpha/beta fold hydrolase [Leifsonia sp. fls2-241-R2A-40a]
MASSPQPVLLFLHGRYGLRDDLSWIAERAPAPWRTVMLQGSVPLGDRFEWFRVSDENGRGALSADAAPAADRLLSWIEETVGDAPVGAVGWSQGGATALQALRRAPGRLRFVVTLGGFTTLDGECGDAELEERRPPVFWGRGADDTAITADDLARMREFLPAHSTLEERVYPGTGHDLSDAMADDALRFIAAQSGTLEAVAG